MKTLILAAMLFATPACANYGDVKQPDGSWGQPKPEVPPSYTPPRGDSVNTPPKGDSVNTPHIPQAWTGTCCYNRARNVIEVHTAFGHLFEVAAQQCRVRLALKPKECGE